MQGEFCEELRIDEQGVRGDRRFGVVDLSSSTVISAKREARLLEAFARLSDDDLVVTLPDGRSFSPGAKLDFALSAWLGREVLLADAATYGVATFESPEDFEDDESTLVQWEGNGHSFVDEGALLIMTTAELSQLARERPELQWTAQRFRPNVLVESGDAELSLDHVGARVEIGEIEVVVVKGCTRCVMTTRAQPNALVRQLDILRHVSDAHDNIVGLRANAVNGGVVRIGDEVAIL